MKRNADLWNWFHLLLHRAFTFNINKQKSIISKRKSQCSLPWWVHLSKNGLLAPPLLRHHYMSFSTFLPNGGVYEFISSDVQTLYPSNSDLQTSSWRILLRFFFLIMLWLLFWSVIDLFRIYLVFCNKVEFELIQNKKKIKLVSPLLNNGDHYHLTTAWGQTKN